MDSPFSASTAEAVVATVPSEPPQRIADLVLVAGCDQPVMKEFATFAGRMEQRQVVILDSQQPDTTLSALSQTGRISAVVLFIGRGQHRNHRAMLDAVLDLARRSKVDTVCIVGSFLVHLGDQPAAQAEAETIEQLRPHVGRIVLFRVGNLLSPNSRMTCRLQNWSFLHPLVPSRFSSGFIHGEELFTAIEQEIRAEGQPRQATYTLLGVNRPWKNLLKQSGTTLLQRGMAAAAYLVSWLGIGWLAGHIVDWLSRFAPQLRGLNCSTLTPTSNRELLELYNRYNYRLIKIVGYNNGVVHFGQSFPGKTVISTIRCNRKARVRGSTGTFDAGVTLRQAIDVAGQAGKEFHVLPNYSYVSVGTAFYIPIHGSASEYSTLGDTIDRVLLYDPAEDRFISAGRDDPAFPEYIYNLGRDSLVLRLQFRLKDKSAYYRRHSQRVNPTGAELLALLQDTGASNVEIRKGKAAGELVDVYQYYTSATGETSAEEFPRDALGKLWDKLEANPITAFLFHGLTRWLAFHVEAFFSPEEFVRFWETHRTLPVMKFQLRYIKRDGLPHSPFVEHDCVSADMFMLRKHKPAFEAYIKENFRAVQFNPGKHSA